MTEAATPVAVTVDCRTYGRKGRNHTATEGVTRPSQSGRVVITLLQRAVTRPYQPGRVVITLLQTAVIGHPNQTSTKTKLVLI